MIGWYEAGHRTIRIVLCTLSLIITAINLEKDEKDRSEHEYF